MQISRSQKSDGGTAFFYRESPTDEWEEVAKVLKGKESGKQWIVTKAGRERMLEGSVDWGGEAGLPTTAPTGVSTPKPAQTTFQKVDKAVSGPLSSILQGATLGFSDEIAGALSATGKWAAGKAGITPEVPWGGAYTKTRDTARGIHSRFKKKNTKTDLALGVAGSLPTGGVGAARVAATQGVKKLGTMMTLGAGYGGAAGAGYSSADNPAGIASDAAQGAVIGAAAVPALGYLGEKVVAPIGRNLSGKLMKGSQKRIAQEKVAQALQRDGLTAQKAAQKMSLMGDEALLMDVGSNLTSLANVVASASGKGSKRIKDTLERRAKGEYGRLVAKAKEFIGTDRDFYSVVDEIAATRKAQAAPLYEAAYQQTVTLSPELKTKMANRPFFINAVNKAKEKALNEIGEVPQENSVQYLDYIKRGMDSKIENAWKNADTDKSDLRIYTKLKNEFLSEIDSQVPVYKQARDIYSGYASAEKAANEGVKFTRGEADDLSRTFGSYSESDKYFFRVGVLREITNKTGKVGDLNSISARFQNPAFRARINAVFPGEESAKSFLSATKAESQFANTKNRVLAGSQTHERRMAEQGFTSDVSPSLWSAIGDKALKAVTTPTEGIRDEVGDILLSKNPHQALLRDAGQQWRDALVRSLSLYGASLYPKQLEKPHNIDTTQRVKKAKRTPIKPKTKVVAKKKWKSDGTLRGDIEAEWNRMKYKQDKAR